MLQDSKFFMVVVFFLDHLGHFLEFLVISLRHIGSNSCIVEAVPKRLSSISDFLALYLVFKDLLPAEPAVFYITVVVHSFFLQ